MSKKSVLRFTQKELKTLMKDENSKVFLLRGVRKIPLLPYCLNDLRASIHDALDAKLAKFDHESRGILLSYKNIKIVRSVANVLHDDPYLYITLQADFYVFVPEVGCVLFGIVNKRSADHIGCLVHKAFNVSIPRPEGDEDWIGSYAEIGQQVTFRVDSLDLTGSVPYMIGYLLSFGSTFSPTDEKFTKRKNIMADVSASTTYGTESHSTHNGDTLNDNLEEGAEEEKIIKRDKKKKKKDKFEMNTVCDEKPDVTNFLGKKEQNSYTSIDENTHTRAPEELHASKLKGEACEFGDSDHHEYHRKRKRKRENEDHNHKGLKVKKNQVYAEELLEFNGVSESVSSESPKKKKRKHSNTINNNQISLSPTDGSSGKSLLKTEKKHIDSFDKNVSHTADYGEELEITPKEKKKQKKKEKMKTAEPTENMEWQGLSDNFDQFSQKESYTFTPGTESYEKRISSSDSSQFENRPKKGKTVKKFSATTSTPFESERLKQVGTPSFTTVNNIFSHKSYCQNSTQSYSGHQKSEDSHFVKDKLQSELTENINAEKKRHKIRAAVWNHAEANEEEASLKDELMTSSVQKEIGEALKSKKVKRKDKAQNTFESSVSKEIISQLPSSQEKLLKSKIAAHSNHLEGKEIEASLKDEFISSSVERGFGEDIKSKKARKKDKVQDTFESSVPKEITSELPSSQGKRINNKIAAQSCDNEEVSSENEFMLSNVENRETGDSKSKKNKKKVKSFLESPVPKEIKNISRSASLDADDKICERLHPQEEIIKEESKKKKPNRSDDAVSTSKTEFNHSICSSPSSKNKIFSENSSSVNLGEKKHEEISSKSPRRQSPRKKVETTESPVKADIVQQDVDPLEIARQKLLAEMLRKIEGANMKSHESDNANDVAERSSASKLDHTSTSSTEPEVNGQQKELITPSSQTPKKTLSPKKNAQSTSQRILRSEAFSESNSPHTTAIVNSAQPSLEEEKHDVVSKSIKTKKDKQSPRTEKAGKQSSPKKQRQSHSNINSKKKVPIEEETPSALADRLLQEFLRKRSI